MNLVVRCNYGNDSIALLMWLHQHPEHCQQFQTRYVCYIETGWAAQDWPQRVDQGEALALALGFQVIRLKAPKDFAELCEDQRRFPSHKFQWCAGFLKGIPFLEWLDESDPGCEWTIAIPKRQAAYRKDIPSWIEQCEFHGDRAVWHPIVHLSHSERDDYLHQARFERLLHHSLECQPCINASAHAIDQLQGRDIQKVQQLEENLQQNFFASSNKPIQDFLAGPERRAKTPMNMDSFTMGCGDPFGCGL